MTSNKDTHDGYADFCIFVRKMKRGMHFLRLAGDGSLRNSNVVVSRGNKGIAYSVGLSQVRVAVDTREASCAPPAAWPLPLRGKTLSRAETP